MSHILLSSHHYVLLKGFQIFSLRTVDPSSFPNEGSIHIYVIVDSMVFHILGSEINHKIFEF